MDKTARFRACSSLVVCANACSSQELVPTTLTANPVSWELRARHLSDSRTFSSYVDEHASLLPRTKSAKLKVRAELSSGYRYFQRQPTFRLVGVTNLGPCLWIRFD